MADAIDQAAGAANDSRRATLDAIARGGRAGRQAYQQGQQSIRDAQSQALSQGAANAYGLFSAGTGVQDATDRITSGGYAPYDAALGRLSSAFSNNMATQGSLNSDYFAQAAASAPAYRRMADEQIDEARRRWEAQKAEAEASAQSSADSMPQWKLIANATGLGEQMAGRALEQGQGRLDRGAGAIAAQEMPGSGEGLTGGRAIGAALTGDAPNAVEAHRAEMTRAVQAFQDEHGRAPTREEFAQIQAFVHPERARAVRQVRSGREQVQQAQETPEWAWQRAAANAMGVSEPLAAGLFQPPNAHEQVNNAQDQRQLEFLNTQGGGMFESPQAMRDYQGAMQDLAVPADPLPMADAAAGLGLSPDDTTQIATSPAFIDAIDTFNDGVDAGLPIETINADLQRFFIERYGHDFPTTRELATMMYGHLAG